MNVIKCALACAQKGVRDKERLCGLLSIYDLDGHAPWVAELALDASRHIVAICDFGFPLRTAPESDLAEKVRRRHESCV